MFVLFFLYGGVISGWLFVVVVFSTAACQFVFTVRGSGVAANVYRGVSWRFGMFEACFRRDLTPFCLTERIGYVVLGTSFRAYVNHA